MEILGLLQAFFQSEMVVCSLVSFVAGVLVMVIIKRRSSAKRTKAIKELISEFTNSCNIAELQDLIDDWLQNVGNVTLRQYSETQKERAEYLKTLHANYMSSLGDASKIDEGDFKTLEQAADAVYPSIRTDVRGRLPKEFVTLVTLLEKFC